MSKLILLTLAVLALFSIASAATSEEVSTLWGAWKAAHKKRYLPSEENHRFMVFQQNVAQIAKLNAEYIGAKFAVNQFSDLTSEEFKQKYTSEITPSQIPDEELHTPPITEIDPLPDSFDWRTKGAVTPVKDQGFCGSCWAFAVVAPIESLNIIANNTWTDLSEQQLVDCGSAASGMYGCSGGNISPAYSYAARYGLMLESSYPYVAKKSTCSYIPQESRKVLSGFAAVGTRVVTGGMSQAIKQSVLINPMTVYLQGAQDVMRHYSSGVLSTGCGAQIDHAGVVVGYQKVNGQEAFIVKNSWGPWWGMNGYVYISTNPTYNEGMGACGILFPYPFYPVYI